MAKWGAYIFLLVLTFNTTQLSQLLKLPALFTHYKDHQQRNQGIRFTEFLSMHYWGKDINDNDTKEDNKLPFKKVNCNICMSVYIPVKKIQPQAPVTWHHKDYFIPDNSTLPNTFHCSLFRPPKPCTIA